MVISLIADHRIVEGLLSNEGKGGGERGGGKAEPKFEFARFATFIKQTCSILRLHPYTLAHCSTLQHTAAHICILDISNGSDKLTLTHIHTHTHIKSPT